MGDIIRQPEIQTESACMDVKEAVQVAKDHVVDIFGDEEIENVGLEEIERAGSPGGPPAWKITIGFSRPWERTGTAGIVLGQTHLRRSYKVLIVNDESREVESVRDRILVEAT